VKTLVHKVLASGEYSVVWNGRDDNGKSVSSGIYFYKMKTDNFEKTRKMILMK
jgi:flagellar hook assembly protein FlgD